MMNDILSLMVEMLVLILKNKFFDKQRELNDILLIYSLIFLTSIYILV